MKFDWLSNITFQMMEDEDDIVVAEALWEVMPERFKGELRKQLIATLKDGKPLQMEQAAVSYLRDNIALFRKEFHYYETLLPERGARAMSRFAFLSERLGIQGEPLTKTVQQGVEEHNTQAIMLYAENVCLTQAYPTQKRVGIAKATIETLGEERAARCLVFAYDEDLERSDRAILSGMRKGNPDCAFWAISRGLIKDVKERKRVWEKAKYATDSNAWFEYGLTYWDEEYGRRDALQCAHILSDAANAGSAKAAMHLGRSFLYGLNYAEGRPDFFIAERFLSIADSLGDPDAAYCLAEIYYGVGKGTPKELIDKPRAMRIYERYAAKGHPGALAKIGRSYRHGRNGYAVNIDLAAAYLLEAAKRHSALGCIEYADMIMKCDILGNVLFAHALFIDGMAASKQWQRLLARKTYAAAYRAGLTVPPDEEWADIIESLELDCPDGSREERLKRMYGLIIEAQKRHLDAHPGKERDVDLEDLAEHFAGKQCAKC